MLTRTNESALNVLTPHTSPRPARASLIQTSLQLFERSALAATTFAAIVAAVSFLWGAIENRRAAHDQRQAIAVSMFQDYTKLAIQYPDLAKYRDSSSLQDDRYEWYAAHAFFTAEAIYVLMHGDPVWDSTVASIVGYHHTFVRDGGFTCGSYNAAFREFVRTQLKTEFRCGE